MQAKLETIELSLGVETNDLRLDLSNMQAETISNWQATFERIAVDEAGPFPRSAQGNRYLLIDTDYFAKWPGAYAIPDQEASTVADALVVIVIVIYFKLQFIQYYWLQTNGYRTFQ
jgi:hypothetical protein